MCQAAVNEIRLFALTQRREDEMKTPWICVQCLPILLFAFGQMQSAQAAPDACHPEMDVTQAQFIVGYGSLMQETSKRQTTPNAGNNQPIRVSGFQRAWIVNGPLFSPTTYLGAVPNPAGRFNAVIYSVPSPQEIHATDVREGRYCRSPVAPAQIEMLNHADTPVGQIWMYTVPPNRVGKPGKGHPITQSYVDIFLGGCLDVSEAYGIEEFALECIRTTKGWSKYWINDRIMPRRPFEHQPQARKIDAVLEQTIPQYLKARVIE